MMVEARAEHIAYVFARLAPQTREEMAVAGLDDETLLQRFLSFAEFGETYAFLKHGRAQFIMTIGYTAGTLCTFFVAAKGFFEASLRHVHELREFMKQRVKQFGPILAMSLSPNPNAGRWFELLGGNPIGPPEEKIYLWA